jgi:hypothetical protein
MTESIPKMTRWDRTANMIALYRSGLSLKQIGERYGITRQAVQNRLARQGVSRDDKPEKPTVPPRPARGPRVPKHGTAVEYRARGCRCDACCAANTEFFRNHRFTSALRDDAPQHGTINGYRNYSCRCDACRAANKEHTRLQKSALRRNLTGAHVHAALRKATNSVLVAAMR